MSEHPAVETEAIKSLISARELARKMELERVEQAIQTAIDMGSLEVRQRRHIESGTTDARTGQSPVAFSLD